MDKEYFADYTELPCLDTACMDSCLLDGFTDKFCATKCDYAGECLAQYGPLVATNDQFLTQSTNFDGLAVDPLTLEVTFENTVNEIVFLEEYLAESSDKQLFDRVQVAKQETINNTIDQDLYAQTRGYFTHALDAYTIERVENVYLDWKKYVSDLPANVYHITLADGTDTQRLMADLSVL